MMTRNIRKAISVICVVAMLLSLCVVAFVGTSSAAPVAKEDPVTTVWETTVLEMNFDNGKGIVAHGYAPVPVVYPDTGDAAHGKALQINGGGAPSYQLGKDGDQAWGGEQLKLEAGATYRITFEYKWRAGSKAGAQVRLVRGAIGNSARQALDGSYAKLEEDAATDTAWTPYEYIYTVGDSSRLALYLSGDFNTASGTLWIDNVKIEKGAAVAADINNEYTFDWKTGETPIDTNEIGKEINSGSPQFVFSGLHTHAHPASVATAEGLKFSFASGNGFTTQSYGWNNNAVVYDTDAVVDGSLLFKKDTAYIVTVKYKATDMGGNNEIGLAIAADQHDGQGGTKELSYVTIKKASDDWQYLTAAFDTATAGVGGKYLFLTGRSNEGKAAVVLVESVTVKERRDVDAGVAIIKKVVDGVTTCEFATPGVGMTLTNPENNNPDRGFDGWYVGDQKVEDVNNFVPVAGVNTIEAKWVNEFVHVTLDNLGTQTVERIKVGNELARPVRPDGRMFFLGWFDENGTEVTKVPGDNITLYAKYTGTMLQFNNIASCGTTSTAIIEKDPADPNNNVLKFTSNAEGRHNWMVPSADMAGAAPFELKVNTTYFYSFKMKTAANSAGGSGSFLRGDKNSGSGTHRSFIGGADYSAAANATDTVGEWVTIEGQFTTGATQYLDRSTWAYENHLFFSLYNDKKDVVVYIDDFVIGPKITEKPEGASMISFETNGPEIMDMYGYPGEAISMPANPQTGGAKFIGWYADKKLKTPFTDTVFGTEDITLYAKWEASDFLVDFSQYEQGSKSERAKFVNEGGNDYLDWSVKHATNNTGDTGTPYRVFLNKGGAHYTVDVGGSYTIKFKYKLLEGDVTIQMVANGRLNGWSYPKVQDGSLKLSNVNKDKWQEGTITVASAKVDTAAANYLSFGIAGHGHVLIDDISVSAATSTMNLYGSKRITFMADGGKGCDPMSGEPGEEIGTLPTPVKAGYAFDGWFADEELKTPFTQKTYGDEDIVVYAAYLLGKFNENYEGFPAAVTSTGFGGAYKLYNTTNFKDTYDKGNVQSGDVSVFRNGDTKGAKAFTVCRTQDLALTVGKQYTITFYVKPTEVTQAAGTIGVINMKSNTTGINTPTSTEIVTTVGELKAGQWQKVSHTFTATDKYVGITTTEGNDMYFDNVTVTLKGYSGTTTGDSSVSPVFILMMIILAAGALTITGKKVFDK